MNGVSRNSPFQSPPPRGGRQAPAWAVQMPEGRFNPRPRAGGDARPTRPRSWPWPSFNPRPRAGGDVIAKNRGCRRFLFQSPPPRGGRRPRGAPTAIGGRVSIPAPARGATSRAGAVPAAQTFQSPPPRGGRPDTGLGGAFRARRFNPRPRAGGDPRRTGSPVSGEGFNPRPRAGGDSGSVTHCCATANSPVSANVLR